MMNRGRGERNQPESFASKKRRLSGIGDKQNKLPQGTASSCLLYTSPSPRD